MPLGGYRGVDFIKKPIH